MKGIFFRAFWAVAVLAGLSAHASAQLTKSQLNVYNNAHISANGVGGITGPILNLDIGQIITAMCGIAQPGDCPLPSLTTEFLYGGSLYNSNLALESTSSPANGGPLASDNLYLFGSHFNVQDYSDQTLVVTAVGTYTLTFASVPAWAQNIALLAMDVTHISGIPITTYVSAWTSNTITFANSSGFANVSGVSVGDTITFGAQPSFDFVDNGIASSQGGYDINWELLDSTGAQKLTMTMGCATDNNAGAAYLNTAAGAWVANCDFIGYGFGPPQTTNNSTALGNATLHFAASEPWVIAGQVVTDITTPSAIPAGTTVVSKTSNTVVMSQNAAGSGVGNGDVIQFSGQIARWSFVGPQTNGFDDDNGGGGAPDVDDAYVWGWVHQRWHDVETVNEHLTNLYFDASSRYLAYNSGGAVLQYIEGASCVFQVFDTGPFRICGVASNPSGIAGGEINYNTTSNELFLYNGSNWGQMARLNDANTFTGTLGITPATWADNQSCTAGQISADASFIYVCTATNTVKRATLSTF